MDVDELLKTLPRPLQMSARAAGTAQPMRSVTLTEREHVDLLMNWANQTRCPVVPLSSKDAILRLSAISHPRNAGALIADLSHLDSIVHIDANDGRAIIEPGVTFAKLHRELKPHGMRPFMPLLPRPGKSVLAAYLDRQPTTSPHDHWDSEDPIGGTSVVFGNGESFQTGTAAVPGNLQEQLKRGARQLFSVGPSGTDFLRVIQGSQGTIGIVKWAAVYCEPMPALEKAYFVGSSRLEDLADIAYDVLWHRMGGQLWIANRHQVEIIADTVSPGALADAVAPEWVLYVNLVAPDFRPAQKLAYLTNDLKAAAARRNLVLSESIGALQSDVIRAHAPPENSPDYRAKSGRDFASIFFLSQMDKASRLLADARAGLRGGGENAAGIYLQPRVHGASCHVEINLMRSEATEPRVFDERRSRLIRDCAKAGAYFSRPYGEAKDIAFSANPIVTSYMREAKELFDPNGILCPGRFPQIDRSVTNSNSGALQ